MARKAPKDDIPRPCPEFRCFAVSATLDLVHGCLRLEGVGVYLQEPQHGDGRDVTRHDEEVVQMPGSRSHGRSLATRIRRASKARVIY